MKKRLIFSMILAVVMIVCCASVIYLSPAQKAAALEDAGFPMVESVYKQNERAGIIELELNAATTNPENIPYELPITAEQIADKTGWVLAQGFYSSRSFYVPTDNYYIDVKEQGNIITITAKRIKSDDDIIVRVAIKESAVTPNSEATIFILKVRIKSTLKYINSLRYNSEETGGVWKINTFEQRIITIDQIRENTANSIFRSTANLKLTCKSTPSEIETRLLSDERSIMVMPLRPTPLSSSGFLVEITVTDADGKSLTLSVTYIVAAATATEVKMDTVAQVIKGPGEVEILASKLAHNRSGIDVYFMYALGPDHALYGDPDYMVVNNEVVIEKKVNDKTICKITFQTDSFDPKQSKIIITPYANGSTSLSVKVHDLNPSNPTSTSQYIDVTVPITISGIYHLEQVSLDNLFSRNYFITDTTIFSSLKQDGYGLISVEPQTEESLGIVVASVEQGYLHITPKKAGATEILLRFSNGSDDPITLIMSVNVHKFSPFRDLTIWQQSGIILALLVIIGILVLVILRRKKRKQTKAINEAESKVVIGKRDPVTGVVFNPVVQKIVQPPPPMFQQRQQVALGAGMGGAPQNTNLQLGAGVPNQNTVNMQQLPAATPGKVSQFRSPIAEEQQFLALNEGVKDSPKDADVPLLNVFFNEEEEHIDNSDLIKTLPVEEETPIVVETVSNDTIVVENNSEPISAPETVKENKANKKEAEAMRKVKTQEVTDEEILNKVYEEEYKPKGMKLKEFMKNKQIKEEVIRREREKMETPQLPEDPNLIVPVVDPDLLVFNESSSLEQLHNQLEAVTLMIERAVEGVGYAREEEELASKTVFEATQQFASLSKHLEDLRIELANVKNPDEAGPIYEDLNKTEAEYNQLRDNMEVMGKTMMERQSRAAKAEAEFLKLKTNLEFAKMDIEDGIEAVKAKEKDNKAKQEQENAQKQLDAEMAANQEEANKNKEKYSQEMDIICESILRNINELSKLELKNENVKFKREIAEQEITDLDGKIAAASDAMLRITLTEQRTAKHEDVKDYNSKISEINDEIRECKYKIQEQDKQLTELAEKFDLMNKLQSFNVARIEQEFEYKVELEKLQSEKRVEKERYVAQRNLSEKLGENAKAAELAKEAARKEREQAERALYELAEKSKLSKLQDRLELRKSQLQFVADDINDIRDAKHGKELELKLYKLESSFTDDEKVPELLNELEQLKGRVRYATEMAALKERETTPQPVDNAVQQQAPKNKTVVRKVTNTVNRIPVKRDGQGQRPAGARPAGARPAGARPAGSRPAGARPAGSRPAGARPAGARPAGARPAGARPASSARPGATRRPTSSRPTSSRPTTKR